MFHNCMRVLCASDPNIMAINISVQVKSCLICQWIHPLLTNPAFQRKSNAFGLFAGFNVYTSCNLYGLQGRNFLRICHTLVRGTWSSLLVHVIDFLGLLFTVSLDICGWPGLFPEHKHPVDLNCCTHHDMQFLCGGYMLNFVRKCLALLQLSLFVQTPSHKKPSLALRSPSYNQQNVDNY